jgi:hypothetical protein
VAGDAEQVFKHWCELFWQAGDKIGRTFRIARDGTMQRLMEEAGFVDVRHRVWKVPIGGWPRGFSGERLSFIVMKRGRNN